MKLLTKVLGGFSVLAFIFADTAIAQLSNVVSGKTSDGSQLRIYPESIRLENKYWRSFSYDIIRPDGSTVSRTATTPWCRNGKIELDTRATSDSNQAYQKGASWYASDVGRIVYADSPASRNLLQKVCEITPQRAMQSPSRVSTNTSTISYPAITAQQYSNFISDVRQSLIKKSNPTAYVFNNEQTVEMGEAFCNGLDQGGDLISLIVNRQMLVRSNSELSNYQKEMLKEYIFYTGFYSTVHLCNRHYKPS